VLGKRLTASGDVVGVKLRRTEELGRDRCDVDFKASDVRGCWELVIGSTDVDVKASEVSSRAELVENSTDIDVKTSGVDVDRELVDGNTEVDESVVVALVCKQGTMVVIVTSRSVVNVFLAVRGQSVTEAGHFVIVSITVERIVDVVEDAEIVDEGKETTLVDVKSADVVRLIVAFVGDTTTLVREQGTIVVIVTSRSVVKVVLAVRGQSVTEAGHFVIVSVTVERIVDVVEEARTDVDGIVMSLVDVDSVNGIRLNVAFVGDTTTLLLLVMARLAVLTDDWTVTEDDESATEGLVLKVDVSISDDVQIIEVSRMEVGIAEIVSEQGTTVVIVVIRTAVNVLLAVNGLLVMFSGHCVIVSISVETIVEVVESAEVVRAPTTVLLLLYVPSVTEPWDCVVGNAAEVLLCSLRPLVLWTAVSTELDVWKDEYDVKTLEVVEVSEQGTTVVRVAIRVVKYVLRELKGQSVTDAGHLVMVSTMVESTVDAVDESGAAAVLLTGEVTMLEVVEVSEQGTTVVMVVTRVVKYVLRELKGQSSTDAGHLVIVSTMVERIVDVVDESGTAVVLLTGETTMLVLLEVVKSVVSASGVLEVVAMLLLMGVTVVLIKDVTGRTEVTVDSVE
jgi:hypothetical protein